MEIKNGRCLRITEEFVMTRDLKDIEHAMAVSAGGWMNFPCGNSL
jgi:hypothetical protein